MPPIDHFRFRLDATAPDRSRQRLPSPDVLSGKGRRRNAGPPGLRIASGQRASYRSLHEFKAAASPPRPAARGSLRSPCSPANTTAVARMGEGPSTTSTSSRPSSSSSTARTPSRRSLCDSLRSALSGSSLTAPVRSADGLVKRAAPGLRREPARRYRKAKQGRGACPQRAHRRGGNRGSRPSRRRRTALQRRLRSAQALVSASHARGRRFETRRAHLTEAPLRRGFCVPGRAVPALRDPAVERHANKRSAGGRR